MSVKMPFLLDIRQKKCTSGGRVRDEEKGSSDELGFGVDDFSLGSMWW